MVATVLALVALFVILPAVELYLLITLGTEVGALNTLLIILVTGTVGAALVRQQGFSVFQRIQAESAAGRLPALELIEGLVLLVAGALLVTPGLLTDATGFLALVAPLRRRAAQAIADRIVVGTQSGFQVHFGSGVGGPPFGSPSPSGGPFPGDAPRRPPSSSGPVVDVESHVVDE